MSAGKTEGILSSENFLCSFIDEILHSAVLKALHWEVHTARETSFDLFSVSDSLLFFDRSRFDWNEMIDVALHYTAALTKKKMIRWEGKKETRTNHKTNFIAAMKPCEFERQFCQEPVSETELFHTSVH